MQGAIYAAIGLGLVMVVILGYVVACCCCSAKRVPRAADTESLLRNATEVKPKRYNRGRVITLVVLSFIVLIFAAATFKPVRSFDDGFNRGLDGVESISNSFKTVEKMLGNATTLLNSVKKPVDEASKEAKDEDLRESLKEFSDNIDGVTHSINDVKGIAGDLHRDIDKTVKNGRHYSNEYAKKFAYAYAGVMCFSITLLLITMIPKYLCACTYKCVGVPTNILFLMVLWIGTGIFLFVGIFFADYCMQPNGNVLKNFQSAHGHDSKASQSVQYYLVCDPSNPNQNITGIAHDLDNLVSKVDSKVVEAYSKVNAKVQSSDNLDKSIKRQFAAANVTVNAVRTTLSHANSLVGCKNVRKPWDSFTVSKVTTKIRMSISAFAHVFPFNWLFSQVALCKDFISDGVIV